MAEEIDKFDEIMNAETPEDKGGEASETPSAEEETAKQEPSVEDRLASLEEDLKTEKLKSKGLLKGKKAEVRNRQDVEAKMTQLTDTLSGILVKRDATVEEPPESNGNLVVEVDDDGNPYIPADSLAGLNDSRISSLEKTIKDLQGTLSSERQHRDAQARVDEEVGSVVRTIEGGNAAQKSLDDARTWLNDRVGEFMKENDIPAGTFKNVSQAMDGIDGSDVEAEFNKKFPGKDMETTARAYEGRVTLKRALNSFLPTEKEGVNGEMDKSLKKIAEKQPSLGGAKNQKTSVDTTLTEIAGLSSDDILNAPDAQIDKIRALLKAQTG